MSEEKDEKLEDFDEEDSNQDSEQIEEWRTDSRRNGERDY